MNHPVVSILLTSFNAEKYIALAIESILHQTFTDWELIILDDCSTDSTRNIISDFDDKRIRHIYPEKNLGYVASKNVLLKQVSGSFACFVDADDWIVPDFLKKYLSVFSEHSSAMACMSSFMRVMPDTSEKPQHFYDKSRFISYKEDEILFAGAGIMFRSEVIKIIDGFEPFFDKLMGDDNYWAVKIAERFPFYYLREPLYYYRSNINSITATFDNPKKLTIIAILKELKRQRKKTGTDWLEQKDFESIRAYEKKLLADKKWIAEQYRTYAAVRLDYNDFKTARQLLAKAFRKNPFDIRIIRTSFYMFRQMMKSISKK